MSCSCSCCMHARARSRHVHAAAEVRRAARWELSCAAAAQVHRAGTRLDVAGVTQACGAGSWRHLTTAVLEVLDAVSSKVGSAATIETCHAVSSIQLRTTTITRLPTADSFILCAIAVTQQVCKAVSCKHSGIAAITC